MDREAVLFANEAFYRAFADRDYAAMEALWAKDAPVLCIHPGWAALTERADVMKSWRSILSNPNSPAMSCHAPEVFFYGDLAAVVCYEGFAGGYLVATNLFVRQGSRWMMVHHQAGPSSSGPPEREEPANAGPVH